MSGVVASGSCTSPPSARSQCPTLGPSDASRRPCPGQSPESGLKYPTNTPGFCQPHLPGAIKCGANHYAEPSEMATPPQPDGLHQTRTLSAKTSERARDSGRSVKTRHAPEPEMESRQRLFQPFRSAPKALEYPRGSGPAVLTPADRRKASAGRSAVWLARLTGGQEVAGSNPVAPSDVKQAELQRFLQYPRCRGAAITKAKVG